MSIQRMRRRFAVQLRVVLWALTIAFIVGLPLVFVPGGRFSRQRQEEEPPQASAADVVARVDGEPIMKQDLDRDFNRMVGQLLPIYAQIGQSVGLERLGRFRLDAMEQAIETRLLLDQAKKDGLSVSKGDLKKKAAELADQEIAQLKSRYTQQAELERVFAQIVAQQDKKEADEQMSERQFRKWVIGRYLDPTTGLRDDLVLEQLKQKAAGSAAATEQDLLQSYDVARVRHVLISLRPGGKPERTEEQAKQRAEALLAKIKGGQDFAKVAAAESDDPEALRTGGLLKEVGRGRMPQEWEKAVFVLKPGEMTGALKLPWGYEIVRMEKIERKLPPDFEKNKQQLMSSFQQQRQDEVWRGYVSELRQKAKVEVVSPELQAYQALAQGRQDEALAKLKEAAPEARADGGIGAASVFFEMATLLAARNDWQAAADAYADSGDALASDDAALMAGGRAEALLGMGHAYEQLKETDEAVMWYTAASDASEVPSVHAELKTTFQRLGKQDLVERETAWMQNYEQLQRERQKAMEEQQKAMQKQGQAAPAPVAPAMPAAPVAPVAPGRGK